MAGILQSNDVQTATQIYINNIRYAGVTCSKVYEGYMKGIWRVYEVIIWSTIWNEIRPSELGDVGDVGDVGAIRLIDWVLLYNSLFYTNNNELMN